LNRTMYKDIRSTVLGSRDQLCIHDSVCKQLNARVKTSVCRSMISRRSCQYYNKLDRTPVNILNDIFAERSSVPDIEDMVAIGQKHGNKATALGYSPKSFFTFLLYLLDIERLIRVDASGGAVVFGGEAHTAPAKEMTKKEYRIIFPSRPSLGVSEFNPKHCLKQLCLCQFIEKICQGGISRRQYNTHLLMPIIKVIAYVNDDVSRYEASEGVHTISHNLVFEHLFCGHPSNLTDSSRL
uniref:DEAD_2 domain-containing protein n=1 Tax=Angiostrongylus cantonensis TaxID=6313 RepID=A0A0K0DRE3_ANGCA